MNELIMLDVDWINTRAAQSFPLADTASGISKGGTKLPDSFLLDLQLLFPSKYDQDLSGAFYISAIQDRGNTYAVIISYHPLNSSQDGSQDIQCAICQGISKNCTITGDLNRRTYIITPLQVSSQLLEQNPWINKITGNICIGNTATYSGGSLTFSYQNGAINSACLIFLGGNHLQGIRIGDKLLTGVVQFVAGDGIQFTVQGNTVQISVNRTFLQDLWNSNIASYFADSQTAQQSTAIRTINGVKPSAGNIDITGIECIQVNQAGTGGLTITNTCAKPCCTVDGSLQAVEANIKVIQQQQQILRDYYINMATVVNYMQANLSTLMNQF